MITVFVDADACPVKDEIYRVAKRLGLRVLVVANGRLTVPHDPNIELVVVPKGALDAADDWIAERADDASIVVTQDIPLAARSLAKGAKALDPRGRVFTDEAIGDALATRELMAQLRDMGTITGGPAPFTDRDRSKFLQSLDTVVQKVMKAAKSKPPIHGDGRL
ncbi:MAG TPA: YaiI/YqxD family protein [Holophagaceae bacterium]|nr:YaiI/YqxD family protein [Holophagaceae bacterium]